MLNTDPKSAALKNAMAKRRYNAVVSYWEFSTTHNMIDISTTYFFVFWPFLLLQKYMVNKGLWSSLGEAYKYEKNIFFSSLCQLLEIRFSDENILQ